MRIYLISFLAIVTIFIQSFRPVSDLTVTSTVFKNNGMIPAKYSCEGDGVSPPLQVSDIPSTAKSLALVMYDPDAPGKDGFTHWVMWNMDVIGTVQEGFKYAKQGTNSTGKNGYKGMCPPSGTHHYHFRVYALDQQMELDENNDRTALEKAMQGHILAQGELIGLYKKMK